MRSTIMAVALLGLMSSQGTFAAKRTHTPIETVNAIYVQCPNQWLREHVRAVLQDQCACVSSNPSEADATLDVTYTDTPGTIAPLRDVKVSAKLLQNQTVLWHEQNDYPVAGTPSAPPKLVALRLSTGLVMDLQVGDARTVTQQVLRRASRIAIVPHFAGDYDWNTAQKWIAELQRKSCPQAIIDKSKADVLLVHTLIMGPQEFHAPFTVDCTSTSTSVDCSDSWGGSSSTYCIGDYCSSSSVSGSPASDVRFTQPVYVWRFIDPRTGMQIGEWEMHKDNLKKVEKILGCK